MESPESQQRESEWADELKTLGDPPPPTSGSNGAGMVAAVVLGVIFIGVIIAERALARAGG